MTKPKGKRKTRARGAIQGLPSGALRVSVYAGMDPMTGQRHYLREVIPADAPDVQRLAEEARTRLVNQINERRHPRTNASLNELLDKYLATVELGDETRETYRGYINKHVRPFLGSQKLGAIDADMLESLYAELRRCRDHCTGRSRIDHRTNGKHTCDERCRPHTCKPLARWTVRKIHFIISGAYQAAIRWRWASVNPAQGAMKPTPPPTNPNPPTAAEAARILNAAWQVDPEWGTHVWLAMTTGARRGELCNAKWQHLDLDGEVLQLTATKTGGQRRRAALDPKTTGILREHLATYTKRMRALGIELRPDAYLFSKQPNHMAPLKPSSVSQRYKRLTNKLGIDTHLHNLRHYSATELIAGGVDVRTVAGRLGHTEATTTLRVYAAWLTEADQRAAKTLFSRMPEQPRVTYEPENPNELVAVALRDDIIAGHFPEGEPLPPVKDIAATHQVSIGTAHRALERLKGWGLVTARRGVRATVTPHSEWPSTTVAESAAAVQADQPVDDPLPQPASLAAGDVSGSQLLDFCLKKRGSELWKFSAEADPSRAADLRQVLAWAVRRTEGPEADPGDYELDIRHPGETEPITTFVDLFAVKSGAQ